MQLACGYLRLLCTSQFILFYLIISAYFTFKIHSPHSSIFKSLRLLWNQLNVQNISWKLYQPKSWHWVRVCFASSGCKCHSCTLGLWNLLSLPAATNSGIMTIQAFSNILIYCFSLSSFKLTFEFLQAI